MSLLFDALKRAQESDAGAEQGGLSMDRAEPEVAAAAEQGDSQFIDLAEPEASIPPVASPAASLSPNSVVSPPAQEAALLAAQSIFSATARQSRRIVTLAVGGLVILLLAGGGGFWYYQRTLASFASHPAIAIAPPEATTADPATPPPQPPTEAEPPVTPEAASSGGQVPPPAVSPDPANPATPPANDPVPGTEKVAVAVSAAGADASSSKPAPTERVTAAASFADNSTADRVPILTKPAKPGSGEGASARKPQSPKRLPRQTEQRAQPEKGSAQPVTENLNATHIRLSAGTDPLGDGYQALSEGRLADAERHYLDVIAKRPQERDALLGLAVIAHRKLQTERATELYRQVLREDHGNATATAALVNLSVQVDPVAAESRLKQLLDQQPSSPELYHALGQVLARQKRWGEAQQAFFRAFTLEPENAQYAYNLAVALDRLHKPSAALPYYEKAAQILKPGDAALDRDTIQRRVQELRSAMPVDGL